MSPTLAAAAMSLNLWLPFWINIGLLTCAVPIISLLPNSLKTRLIGSSSSVFEGNRDDDVEENGPLLPQDEGNPSHHVNAFEKPRGFFQEIVHALLSLVALIRGRRNFQVLLCSFFLTALASSDTKLLVQYISKRYEWTFAEVSLSSLIYQIVIYAH
jgi:hypothetical protein